MIGDVKVIAKALPVTQIFQCIKAELSAPLLVLRLTNTVLPLQLGGTKCS